MRAATAGLIVLLAASGAPAQTVQGDPKATQEVEAAWERLGNLKTYRLRITMPVEKPEQAPTPPQSDGAGLATSIISNILSGNWLGLFFNLLSAASARQEQQQQQKEPDEVSAVMEVVNPDRVRTIMQVGTMKMESIAVGRESRFRVTGVRGMSESWQCPKAPDSAAAPAAAEPTITLQATRGAEVVIDGVKTEAFDVTQTMDINGTKDTMRYRLYVLADRGLPRRMESLENDKVETTSDYYDYDAPIVIELPNCEAGR